jgi:hypothetical protein
MKRWLETVLLLVGFGLPGPGQADGVRSPRDSSVIVHGLARPSRSFDSSRLASPSGQPGEAALSSALRAGAPAKSWLRPCVGAVITVLERLKDHRGSGARGLVATQMQEDHHGADA